MTGSRRQGAGKAAALSVDVGGGLATVSNSALLRRSWAALVLSALLGSGCSAEDPGAAQTPETEARASQRLQRACDTDCQPENDIDVGFIERRPRMNYDATPNVPAVGSSVLWMGRVLNHGPNRAEAVPFEWRVNGATVSTGTVSIPAHGTVFLTFSHPQPAARETIALVVDPAHRFPGFTQNDRVEVQTDSLSIGLWVERGLYDYMEQHQRELGVGSNGVEDWAQRMAQRMNTAFAQSDYDTSPGGLRDRVRIDLITIVATGALPLNGGVATNNPDMNNKTVDLMWGLEAESFDTYWGDTVGAREDNPFFVDWGLIHELGHARYLIDVYGFNVHAHQVLITVGSVPLYTHLGIPTPDPHALVFPTGHHGIMSGHDQGPAYAWGRYGAGALRRISGQRARLGNMNAPGNIGEFLQELPTHNWVTVRDSAGAPVPGATISIYRAAPAADPNDWYGKLFDNTVDATFTTDATGRVDLGRCPFSSGSTIIHTRGQSNAVMIARIAANGQSAWRVQDVGDFNIQYWAGNRTNANYDWTTNIGPAADPCPALNACGACAARAGCGWCGTTNSCTSGTAVGPRGGSCGAGQWFWTTSSCPAAVDACAATTDCRGCTAQAACGWCGAAGRCMTGTSSGPRTGSCSASWSWTSSSCPGAAVCTSGATQSCYAGPTGTSGVGRCRAGTQTCGTAGWGACTGSIIPAAETCGNGVDDDCDGQVDEGCMSGSCGSYGTLVDCDAHATTCAWYACSNSCWARGTPIGTACPTSCGSIEICGNGRDDDCDGQIDNPCSTATCTASLPTVWTCSSDGSYRRHCVGSTMEIQLCRSGCLGQPTGTDDTCR